METNDIAIYSGVNRSTQTQAGVMIWIPKSITTQLLTAHIGAKE
jgi:hypothetical protein